MNWGDCSKVGAIHCLQGFLESHTHHTAFLPFTLPLLTRSTAKYPVNVYYQHTGHSEARASTSQHQPLMCQVLFRQRILLGVMAHICNLSTPESEAGLVAQAQAMPHRERLPPIPQKTNSDAFDIVQRWLHFMARYLLVHMKY